MRLLITGIVMFGIVGGGSSQSAQQNVPQATAPTSGATYGAVGSPEAYKAALKLVEESGARQAMTAALDDVVRQSKAEFIKREPGINSLAADEWAKRLRARTNIDDFVAVIAKVYAAHFTASELDALIEAGDDRRAGKNTQAAPELIQKFTSEQIEMNSEVIGGCAQIGAKLGGEIEVELRKEHPEWFKSSLLEVKP